MSSKNRSLHPLISCILYIFCLLSSLSNGSSPPTKHSQPNIIFLLMDDIGWNDVGFNGGQFPTPNIDSLHTNGVSLTRHYIHLMCSPSRSQIITGRYAMYQGFGKMLPWDYTEIGGIPQGQATIASWLKWGGYTTYAVGKWHMGYAADMLLPTKRGFDHFYGFYQGAIHYDNLKYIDIKYGDSNHFDFWDDAEEQTELVSKLEQRHEAITAFQTGLDVRDNNDDNIDYSGQSIYDDNTMYLYRDKIIKYIDSEIYNENGKKKKHITPFYMYLALQTIHGPLNEVPDKIDECKNILPSDATNRRHKYCQNMLLTDDIIGDILNKIKEIQSVYDNTLIIFTSDNGGDIANKGCNYPLRGTKGTLFDGNLRTIALISGGIIPEIQRGTQRDILFSSLDWTPTLLKYAGLLNKISRKDSTWDGINQYDVIMNGITDESVIDNDDNNKLRDHIVMNIGSKNLDSASIVFKYYKDNKLYKYVSKSDSIDRWAYIRDDGWCVPDENGNFNLILDDDISMAHDVDNRFLFDLTDDIAEKTNLLQYTDAYNNQYNNELIEYAKSILARYTEHILYSEPLTFLWNRLPAGNPSILGEGTFVAPFLNDNDYVWHIRKGFHAIDAKIEAKAKELGVDIEDLRIYSKALQGTYFVPWQPPILENNELVIDNVDSITSNNHIYSILIIIVCIASILYSGYKYCYQWSGKKDGYQPIKTDENIKTTNISYI